MEKSIPGEDVGPLWSFPRALAKCRLWTRESDVFAFLDALGNVPPFQFIQGHPKIEGVREKNKRGKESVVCLVTIAGQ